MNRRESERFHRYLPVRAWRHGEAEPLVGHTSNISLTGLYLIANRVYLSGTRVRLEIGGSSGFCAEGVVIRSLRSPPQLQRIKPNGMGIRFLRVRELVSELLQIPIGDDGGGGEELSPPGAGDEAGAPVAADETPALSSEPAAPVRRTPELVSSPPPAPPASSASGGARFHIRYPLEDALRQAIVRDLSAGGLFVPTIEPAALHAVVVIEVGVGDRPGAEIVGRVVHRIDPHGPDGSMRNPNLMAGMGIQVLDPDAARRALEALL